MKTISHFAATFILAISLGACAQHHTILAEDSDFVAAESDRLNRWLSEKYAEELARSPITLTSLGRKDRYDQIDDFSEAEADDYLAWQAATVAELKDSFDYQALTPDARLSYDMWIYRYEQSQAFVPYRRHEYQFTQMNNPHAWLPNFLINEHKVDTADDMHAYIKRIGGISRAIGQILERARLAATEGVRPPVFAYENVISVTENLIRGEPFDPGAAAEAPLWADARGKITALLEAGAIDQAQADALLRQTREALLTEFQPAWSGLLQWALEEIKQVDETARGIHALPDGGKYYETILKYTTNSDMGADRIHELGLKEVARIRDEMEAIRQAVGFTGSLQEFFTYIRTDKRFFYPDTDVGRNAYLDDARTHLDDLQKKLPEYFGRLPKAGLVVKRVEPFREQAGAPQHYYPGTKDGSRPGTYYVHLLDMSALSTTELEAIAYHEGVPGHHLQISIARELEGVPEFRTTGGSVSYTEGWALYAEYLAKEMGAYQDPYSNLGRLMTEMWRAVRLVLDTGIHAKGWDIEQAVAFFRENSPKPEGQIRVEVERYFALPGQATAYKIGMLKFLGLREKAKAAMGEQFDIRAFHDTVLGSGYVPLFMLDRLVDDYIKGAGGIKN